MSENKTPLMILRDSVNTLIEMAEIDKTKAIEVNSFTLKARAEGQIQAFNMILKEIEELLPKEREVIENFGDKCQIISDVDIDGNVKFSFTPEELFKINFEQ